MPTPTRPSLFLDWTDGAGTKVVEPSSGQKLTGWVKDQAPPFQYMNWTFWLSDSWIQWLDYVTDAVLSQAENIDADNTGHLYATGADVQAQLDELDAALYALEYSQRDSAEISEDAFTHDYALITCNSAGVAADSLTFVSQVFTIGAGAGEIPVQASASALASALARKMRQNTTVNASYYVASSGIYVTLIARASGAVGGALSESGTTFTVSGAALAGNAARTHLTAGTVKRQLDQADALLTTVNNRATVPTAHLFTSSGNFSVPAGIYTVFVEVLGGGGAGGAGQAVNQAGGGGGGAGGYSAKTVTVTPGASIPYVVGAAGGNSSFNSTVAVGNGGAAGGAGGGAGNGGGLGGAGGTASGGDINTTGNMGDTGGGAGGLIGEGGTGGSSPYGSGGYGGTGNGAGVAGTGYGAGGGGASGNGGTGAGTQGLVVIWY